MKSNTFCLCIVFDVWWSGMESPTYKTCFSINQWRDNQQLQYKTNQIKKKTYLLHHQNTMPEVVSVFLAPFDEMLFVKRFHFSRSVCGVLVMKWTGVYTERCIKQALLAIVKKCRKVEQTTPTWSKLQHTLIITFLEMVCVCGSEMVKFCGDYIHMDKTDVLLRLLVFLRASIYTHTHKIKPHVKK